MNDKSYPKIYTSTLAALLAGACVVLPVACSDDDRVPSDTEAGAGGDTSTGGKPSTGGGESTGAKPGTGGAGGGPSSGGAGGTSTGGTSAGGASTGGATDVDASTGGGDNTGGVDAGSVDAGPDGGPRGCSGALDPEKANLCVTFSPEAVNAVTPPDVALNNVGTLIVQVFNTEYPVAGNAAHVIKSTIYPAPPTATPGSSEQVAINALPRIGFNELPETVYVRAFFIDNPAWFATQTGLRYGMQVGGLNFNQGVRPPTSPFVPPVRAVTLTKGKETTIDLRMFAMKKFSATVMKFPGRAEPPAPPLVPADDGQGLLSVGVFAARAIATSALFGGVEGSCVNVNAGPVSVSGFFLNNVTVPTEGTQMWFGAQVNDFNLPQTGAQPPPGSLVSIVLEGDPPVQVAPSTQHALVMPGQYSVTLDPIPTGPSTTAPSPIFLTTVAPPLPDPLPPSYQCPAPTN